MKKIVICGDELTNPNFTGIARYISEILCRIDELIEGKNYRVEVCYPQGKKIYLSNMKNIKLVEIESTSKFRSRALVAYARKQNAVLVIMSPTICRYNNSIIAIHDARPLEPGNSDGFKYRFMQLLIKDSIKRKKCQIVTVSNFQKARISKLYGVNENRIHVIGNGWEHINRINEDRAIFEEYPQLLKGNYFLSIGSVAPHKNYEWIFEMSKKYLEYQFVIAGGISKKDWNYEVDNINLPNVFFLGYTSDEICKALIKECRALLQPSKYEGFGIPPLEALAMGKKIIISNATCFPEIYQNSAVYFDPYDYKFDLENALLQNTSGGDYVLKKHSWEEAAKTWLKLIEINAGGE